jgi:hypothetical protein
LEEGVPTDSILGNDYTSTETGIFDGIDGFTVEPGADAIKEYNLYFKLCLI